MLLTIANDTQTVNIGEQGSCAIPTNTVRTAEWTTEWRNLARVWTHPYERVTTVRSEVIGIDVFSLPESPTLVTSTADKDWPKVLARVPAQLPSQIQAGCMSGIALIVRLQHSTIDYYCKLPPDILGLRNYVISLGR